MVAFAAASLYAHGERVPADAVAAVRAAGSQVLAGEPITATIDEYTNDDVDPGLRDLAGALAAARGQAAILEPAPVSSRAGAALAAAIDLEEVVDAITAITAIAAGTEAGGDIDAQASSVRQRLIGVERVSLDTSGPPSPRGLL